MSMTIQQAIENRERCYKYLIGCGPKATTENVEAVRLSLEALRKQIPTMVTHDATRPECHTCPSCKNVVDRFGTFITGQKVPLYYDYCEFCGQAFDWSDLPKPPKGE